MSSRRHLLALAAMLVAAFVAGSSIALADGDPASDYLLEQSTFLSPDDAHLPAAQAKAIVAMLASAEAHGFTLKLAVIVSRYDLGADPELYREPELYARFLATEDRYVWKNELLVVMPNGYGLYKAKGLPAGDRAVLAALPRLDTTSGPALAAAAADAVRALAARRGITLSTRSTGVGSGSSPSWVEPAEVAGGAVALVVAAIGIAALARRRR